MERELGLPGYWATAEQRKKLEEFELERVHLDAMIKPLRDSLQQNPKMEQHPRGKDLKQFATFPVSSS